MIINNESGFVIYNDPGDSYLDMNANRDWSYGALLEHAYVFLTEASARDFAREEDLDIRDIVIRKIQKVTCVQLD